MTYSENSVLNLISRIHSQSQDFLQGKLFNVGLKELATSHGNILFSLSQNETMNLGELAKRINRDKSTTTILVKKLQNEGFIEIKKDETDARKKIIQLTTKGKSYNEQTAKVSNDLISTCYKGFSQDEKKQLVELLNKLCLNLV
ncbi:MarR family winged helix-turn-helix transcriptional regulator [Treponema pectinovorum]|uniref:MarR family winged helix-turn-helix transcriptional regulator n=1 Tax=Treponema pectinovorum TaxID=164 RepID=UPI0011CAD389|nr:MarR family winged helix-turn-helix transcriptional regulator [Treponema pectinovorum]